MLPHHVDKMPVPGRGLEPEMLVGPEVAEMGAKQANAQKNRADNHMGAVKARRHVKGRTVNMAGETEPRMGIFIGLDPGKCYAEQNGADEPELEPLRVPLKDGVMGPGHRGARY